MQIEPPTNAARLPVARTGRRSLGAALLGAALGLATMPMAVSGSAALAAAVQPAMAPAFMAPTSIVLDGHGYGHGVGLSQWGAYGYAVDHDWTAAQILDRYYGGTVAGTSDIGIIRVRLLAHDDRQTAVVSAGVANLTVDGFTPAGPFTSVVVREVGGVFTVWSRTDAKVCPGQNDVVGAATGWTQLAGSQASVAVRTVTDTTAATDFSALPGLCEPDGKVRSYRGSLIAVNGTAGENRTVNAVPVEHYLRSVVASEISYTWAAAGGGRGAQAVQAQAVAARSYAVADNRYSYAKTCDSQNCQVYQGAAWRASATSSTFSTVERAAVDAAVAATANVVRRVGSTTGAVATTMFSSSSGGHTAPSLLGFTPVVDDGDDTSLNPNHNWSTTITAATLQSKYPAIGTFTGITVLNRNGFGDWGGRVLTVRIEGTASSVTVTGDQLRVALGLKSNWFAPRGSAVATCGGREAPPIVAPPGPSLPSGFIGITPTRVIDTRIGVGTAQAPVPAGCTLVVDTGVPAGATAAHINITSVRPGTSGFIAAYPCGQPRPTASAVQAIRDRVVAGSVTVRTGVDGKVCIYSHVTSELVVDVFGYFAAGAGARFTAQDPGRLLDTRSGAAVAAGSVTRIPVRGRLGVPADATAAAFTVHFLSPTGPGFATVYPCDTVRPAVSTVNGTTGVSTTNHVSVTLSGAGEVCVYAHVQTHLAVDISGWFGASGAALYTAIEPFRAVDTRIDLGIVNPVPAGGTGSIQLAGLGGLPAASGLAGVAGMVTVVGPAATGYLTVHPCLATVPPVSMLRYTSAGNAAVLVAGKASVNGRWCLSPSSTVELLVDVMGYWTT